MNDQELIKKLQVLRAIKPDQEWADLSFRKMQCAMVSEETRLPLNIFIFSNIRGFLRSLPVAQVAGAFGFLFVAAAMLFFVFGGSEQNQQVVSHDEFVAPESADFSQESFVLQADLSKNIGSAAQKRKEANTNFEVRAVPLGDERNSQFETDLFSQVSEKLEKVEGLVSEISKAADAKDAKKLLDEAKKALDEGNLVDALEVLVALERLLGR